VKNKQPKFLKADLVKSNALIAWPLWVKQENEIKKSVNNMQNKIISKPEFAIKAMAALIKTGHLNLNHETRAKKLADLSWEIAEEMFKKQ